ncbi:MAG: anaerobic ribonucleoside-triphosphate reductase activating protein [Lachnospiraceae bacterium]|nr:anaerobic ribonucleoside-triphosphate reductase activating protein [Lachnospiraceae bacterium]
MYYASIKKTDVANGPGVRVSLFVSGCSHGCKGCFNREAWDYQYGQEFTEETVREILEALSPSYIRGLSLLGGEPLDARNRTVVTRLVKKVRQQFPEKDIWCYTGYTYESDLCQWIAEGDEDMRELLPLLDVLVDGEFVEAWKDLRLKFRGSKNQRLIDVKQTLEEKKVVLMAE